MEFSSRASYIKGLIEGFGLKNSEEKSDKILVSVVDFLKDIADKIEELDSACVENKELIESIDDDLVCLEEMVGKSKSFSSDVGSGCSKTLCNCHGNDSEKDSKFYDDEFEKGKNYEVVCPNCKRSLKLSEEDFEEGEVICPDCGEKLEFDFDDETEDNMNS